MLILFVGLLQMPHTEGMFPGSTSREMFTRRAPVLCGLGASWSGKDYFPRKAYGLFPLET